ncbi:MAG: family 16 glycosylhydrolase [Clostridia bacterium]|nr:family 16 glycosylhydrolase [Clostridia bacterium]
MNFFKIVKRSGIRFSALIVLVSFSLCGCTGGITENLNDEPLSFSTEYDLNRELPETFAPSDGYSNGGCFYVVWSAENVSYGDDGMSLSIEERDDRLYGAEMRSIRHYGYGDYEVRMKPSAKAGTASTFFLYTGEFDDPDGDGKGNPHDEIDIEFLGKTPTKVQLNFFASGRGGHEYMLDLGFDATKEFHDYGFRWTENYIVWFVDGKPVYKVYDSPFDPIPKTPSDIFMSYWSGSKDAVGWMGAFEYSGVTSAEYQWVRTTASPMSY